MSLPLSGKTILVTRPAHQAADLADPLKALGADVILMPAIEIARPTDCGPLDAALRWLEYFDIVVLTSVNGVDAVRRRMKELGIPDEALSRRKIAVIGPSTGAALAAWLRPPDVTPGEFVSEAIAEALGNVQDRRILLARADLARADLGEILASHGAKVTEAVAYRIVRPDGPVDLPEAVPDAITVTSSEAAKATAARLEKSGRGNWMSESKVFCIGPITAETVKAMGITPAASAGSYTIPGLIDVLVKTIGSPEAANV